MLFFFFKQKTAYEMRISDWSSDVCSSDLGNNIYKETAASGQPQVGAAGLEGRGPIRQGALEGSNVNVVEELVDMIETQRAYEVNSKMISATDEMLQYGNQKLRSEEHTSELQSLMRISYAVFCLKKKRSNKNLHLNTNKDTSEQ